MTFSLRSPFLPPTASISLHAPLMKLEEQLNCPVCLDFITDPRTLPCLHSFCRGCLLTLSQGSSRSIMCPTCRHRTNDRVDALPVAFHLNNLKEIHSNLMRNVISRTSIICDNCAIARDISYCKECGQFYCQNCIDDHVATGHDFNSLPTESLSMATLTQATLPARQEYCTVHNKMLDNYCETCQCVICYDCRRSVNHEGHHCDAIEESYLRHCQNLADQMNLVDDKIEAINVAVEARLKKEEKVREQGEDVKAEIRMMVERVVNTLYESAKKLTVEVENITTERLNLLTEQKKSTKKALRQLKDFKDFVTQCLETGTFQQILSSTEQIKDRMDHVTRHDLIEFYPSEQPNIEFVRNKDLVSLVEQMGEIITSDKLEKCVVKRIPLCQCLPEEEDISLNICIELPEINTNFNAPVSSISCSVVPPLGDEESQVTAELKTTSKPGVYDVSLSPVFRGYHELSLCINDVQLDPVHVAIPSDLHFSSQPPKPVLIIDNFEYPYSLAIGNSGEILVSEPNSHCVKILDRDVKRVRSFGGEESSVDIEFCYPRGVAITPDNCLLVANDHSLVKLTINGSLVGSIGTEGSSPREFISPDGIAVSFAPESLGQIYVADSGNHRIQVLTPQLTFCHTFGSQGTSEGQFDEPWGVTVDSQGFLYVTDSNNHRVQKFTRDGIFEAQFGADILTSPAGIAISHTNQIYVTDRGSHCIFVFTLQGQLLSSFGSYGSSEDQFNCPGGIDFNGEGLLYVCDYFNKRILVY